MTPEVKAKNDALARKLGLRKERPWDLGLPDLTSAEGHLLLEKTLLERGYGISVLPSSTSVFAITSGGDSEYSIDPDPAVALILAAYKLLVENSNG